MKHYKYSHKDIQNIFTDAIPRLQEVFETLRKDGKFDSASKVEGWPFSDLVRQVKEVARQLEEMEKQYYDKKS